MCEAIKQISCFSDNRIRWNKTRIISVSYNNLFPKPKACSYRKHIKGRQKGYKNISICFYVLSEPKNILQYTLCSRLFFYSHDLNIGMDRIERLLVIVQNYLDLFSGLCHVLGQYRDDPLRPAII